MDNKTDTFKSFFKEQLEDFEMPVKQDLWLSLENSIPVNKPLWKRLYPAVACIISIFVISILGYNYFSHRQLTPKQTQEEITPSTTVVKSSGIKQLPLSTLTTDTTRKFTASIISIPEITENEERLYENITESEKIPENEIKEKPAIKKNVEENKETKKSNNKISSKYISPNIEKTFKPDFELMIAGNGLISMSNKLDQRDIMQSSHLRSYTNNFNVGQFLNNSRPSEDRLVGIKYYQPITFSLLARKKITPHWSVETGISYTKLSSEETWESVEYEDLATNDIKLHYLGIPLKVSYHFISKKYFSLYIAGGGMIEKCISGKAITTSGNTGIKMKSKLDLPEWQFSLNGGIGADFQVIKSAGIFIEPGVSYYFSNGSDIMTIRKDKPLNFTIQSGIRINF